MNKTAISLLPIVFIVAACATNEKARVSAGAYHSPSGDCAVRLAISAQGGFRKLLLMRAASFSVHIADDVTGIAWLSGSELVYSVSPLYGSPGVFLFNCADPTAKPMTLVAARTFNAAYPKGADFFELKSVIGRRIIYYYGADVDEIDFILLRSAPNERIFERR